MAISKSEIVVYSGPDQGQVDSPGRTGHRPKRPGDRQDRRPLRRVRLEGVLPGRGRQRPHPQELPPCRPEVPRRAQGRGLELVRITPGDVGEYLQALESASRPRSSTWQHSGGSLIGWSTATSASSTPRRPSRLSGTPWSKARRRRSIVTRCVRCSNQSTSRTRWASGIGRSLRCSSTPPLVSGPSRSLPSRASSTTGRSIHSGSRRKGGKSREIPVRHDLEQFLREYIDAAKISEGRLFRTAVRKTKVLTKNGMTGIDICRMMKRRLKAAGAAARALLAPLVPGHDGDRSFGAERAA